MIHPDNSFYSRMIFQTDWRLIYDSTIFKVSRKLSLFTSRGRTGRAASSAAYHAPSRSSRISSSRSRKLEIVMKGDIVSITSEWPLNYDGLLAWESAQHSYSNTSYYTPEIVYRVTE